ncbi:hypothetical protein AYI70_g6476 [Smittium culicis]|uniref:Uncharacterized protein n=1 Tax=Smittium culicis TaxID=133412 RepID=A0A1R1XPT8_9FUNG|nr:hypothetical protein AYI70_g10020 [Smittium culicis]OMJ16640.1 hypothetical protein AYI70_g6476 [Smittium culicis]
MYTGLLKAKSHKDLFELFDISEEQADNFIKSLNFFNSSPTASLNPGINDCTVGAGMDSAISTTAPEIADNSSTSTFTDTASAYVTDENQNNLGETSSSAVCEEELYNKRSISMLDHESAENAHIDKKKLMENLTN